MLTSLTGLVRFAQFPSIRSCGACYPAMGQSPPNPNPWIDQDGVGQPSPNNWASCDDESEHHLGKPPDYLENFATLWGFFAYQLVPRRLVVDRPRYVEATHPGA
ncbi:unnamed protein product [Polarella glacialis]|uniref:Uncharacterized protein n=1 Tax=Polarella glacialis TaxID=89957 RepID=A0A813E5D3_POLGL|nr:unnamed protein product [Polarella glacialis]